MGELRVGDRVCRAWPGCVDSVGVVTEITQIHTMFVQEPLVPGAIVKVESGPYWGQVVPFELSDLRTGERDGQLIGNSEELPVSWQNDRACR